MVDLFLALSAGLTLPSVAVLAYALAFRLLRRVPMNLSRPLKLALALIFLAQALIALVSVLASQALIGPSYPVGFAVLNGILQTAIYAATKSGVTGDRFRRNLGSESQP